MLPKTHVLHFVMARVPDVAKRGQHALILIEDTQGNFLLGRKHIYPQEISRMVGGGIEANEESLAAAARELKEETGIESQPHELSPLAIVVAELEETTTQKQFTFTTHIFHYKLSNQQPNPSDDLDGIKAYSPAELRQLIKLYSQLSTQIDENVGFAWHDYGTLYGPIHQIAVDALHQLQSTQPS